MYVRRYPFKICDLESEFVRDYTQLSRQFGEVIDFMWENHGHRITNYREYWEPLFETMAARVEAKGACACWCNVSNTMAAQQQHSQQRGTKTAFSPRCPSTTTR